MQLRSQLTFAKACLDGASQSSPAKNHDKPTRNMLRFRLQLDPQLANELDIYSLIYDGNDFPRSGFARTVIDGILESVHIHISTDKVAFTALAERLSGITVMRLGKAPLDGMSIRFRAIFHGEAEAVAILVAKVTDEDSFKIVLTPAQAELFEEKEPAAETIAPKKQRGRPKSAPPPPAPPVTGDEVRV